MYLPTSFQVEDFDKLAAVIRANGFATVVTQTDGVPFASHLPLRFEPERGACGTLTGHLARANPQAEHLASGQEVLAIFHGPHAYVSPSWYEQKIAVPTWNYVAVHAYGIAHLIDDSTQLDTLLEDLTRDYESGFPVPWRETLPAEVKTKMRQAIVGFEIPVERIEGKFKLSQNRAANDRRGVYQALLQSPRPEDQALAQFMAMEGLIP